MQRLSLVAFAAGVLGATAPCQESTQDIDSPAKQFLPDVARDAALQAQNGWFQQFQDRHQGEWVSRWNYATGTPKAIWGTGLRMSANPVETERRARQLAEQLLADQRQLLGVGGSTLTERTAVKVNHTWVFVYDQSYRGVPVLGGRVDIRLVDNGVVSMFGSQVLPVPLGFRTVPGIDETLARARAMLHLDVDGFVEEAGPKKPGARLVIWADMTARTMQQPNLCWEVTVHGADRRGDEVLRRVFVDAFSGAVLHETNDLHECGFDHGAPELDDAAARVDMAASLRRPAASLAAASADANFATYSGRVMAWANTGYTATTPLSNVPLHNLRVTVGGVTGFTDLNGDFSITNSSTSPLTTSFGLAGRRISQITSDAGAVPTVTTSLIPGTPGSVQFLTSTASATDRAATTVYWVTNDVNEWVRTILVPAPSALAAIDTISARVNVAQTCNASYGSNRMNFYSAGGGCNNTAFGDIIAHEWGHGLDYVFGGISNNNGDGLSEGWGDIIGTYWSGQPILGAGFSTSGGAVRSALNTRTYGSCSEVHCAGEVWMGFAWQLRGRLQSSLGSAAGIAYANQIVIGSIVANATNQPDAVREVFVMDDDDGNLINGTPNYGDLSWAATQRNLPFPVRLLSGVTHTPLTSTVEQLTGRIVQADVSAFSGAVTSVRVRTTIGTATTVRDMIPTGVGNQYVAVIPGAASPATVRYQIEVGNSGAVEVFGSWNYKIGNEDVIYFDDFESGAPGWTHQQVATQDDWQLGAPQGASGTSSGVAWADPSSAFSGANCWGNDLGRPGWNGSYQNNAQNLLRSPTFSTLGKTGVTLQYARWLNVEEGIYDTARIEANGATVWTNPANGNLIDTGWTVEEVAMPNVDNQAAVNLVWRLITDGGLVSGGWNIDDVKVFAFSAVPLTPVTMQMLPEQALLGAPMTLELSGDPNAPVLVVLGDNAGPTTIQGIPTLAVGGAAPQTIPFFLDGTGNLTVGFNAPNVPSASGSFWYAQALSLTNQGQIVVSNPTINLFQ